MSCHTYAYICSEKTVIEVDVLAVWGLDIFKFFFFCFAFLSRRQVVFSSWRWRNNSLGSFEYNDILRGGCINRKKIVSMR